jgi:hypothetical protein
MMPGSKLQTFLPAAQFRRGLLENNTANPGAVVNR